MVVCFVGFQGIVPQSWEAAAASVPEDVRGSGAFASADARPTGIVGSSLLLPLDRSDALDPFDPAGPRVSGDAAADGGRAAGMAARPEVGALFAPLEGLVPTSAFGLRTSPITGEAGEFHTGQDYSAPCGTPVYAADAGTVRAVGWHLWGGGNRVEVDHGNGLITSYNHLQGISVAQGDTVNGGEAIAEIGTSGSSTGCHLHFETILNGEHVDPLRWKLVPSQHTARKGELKDFTPGGIAAADIPSWAQSSTRSDLPAPSWGDLPSASGFSGSADASADEHDDEPATREGAAGQESPRGDGPSVPDTVGRPHVPETPAAPQTPKVPATVQPDRQKPTTPDAGITGGTTGTTGSTNGGATGGATGGTTTGGSPGSTPTDPTKGTTAGGTTGGSPGSTPTDPTKGTTTGGTTGGTGSTPTDPTKGTTGGTGSTPTDPTKGTTGGTGSTPTDPTKGTTGGTGSTPTDPTKGTTAGGTTGGTTGTMGGTTGSTPAEPAKETTPPGSTPADTPPGQTPPAPPADVPSGEAPSAPPVDADPAAPTPDPAPKPSCDTDPSEPEPDGSTPDVPGDGAAAKPGTEPAPGAEPVRVADAASAPAGLPADAAVEPAPGTEPAPGETDPADPACEDPETPTTPETTPEPAPVDTAPAMPAGPAVPAVPASPVQPTEEIAAPAGGQG